MKVRIGFVSNSSSSSYICEVCGENASGYDVDLADWEMIQCDNNHVVCESCSKLSKEEIKEILSHDDGRYCYNPKYCPVCTLKVVTTDDSLNYIIKKYNINVDAIEKEIQEHFESQKELRSYFKGDIEIIKNK